MYRSEKWVGVNGEIWKNCKSDKLECKAEGAVARCGGWVSTVKFKKLQKPTPTPRPFTKTPRVAQTARIKKSTRRRGQKMLKSKKQKFLPVGVKFTPLKPRIGSSRAYRNMPEPVMSTEYTPNDINSRDVGL